MDKMSPNSIFPAQIVGSDNVFSASHHLQTQKALIFGAQKSKEGFEDMNYSEKSNILA